MAELLSSLEVDVLRLYVEGKSYQEIGEQLGRHVKSIDNALQRIKRKLDGHLAAEPPPKPPNSPWSSAPAPLGRATSSDPAVRPGRLADGERTPAGVA